MNTPLPQELASLLLTTCVLSLSACKTAPEEISTGGTLDPHSAASRARLDAAQQAFSGSAGSVTDGSSSDIAMTAFKPGGKTLGMSGFATNDLSFKGYEGARAFSGSKAYTGANKNLSSEMSPLGGMTSDYASQPVASEGGRSFFGKRYVTKAYQPQGNGVRIPKFRSPPVTPVETMIDESKSDPTPISVGDIRKLLNR